jgi:hypothetical protein
VQNPALGGVLLWRFTCGYVDQHKTSNHPPIPLLFIVLPVLFHRETFEVLKSTNRATGLHGFADKFSRTNLAKSDVLLGIQTRAASWRSLTWESLRLGIQSRLVTVTRSAGTVIPVTTTAARGVPQSIRPLVTNAEKLGAWCSELSLFEIGTILKVGF